MHKLYDMLLSACDSYQAMQQTHLHCLATDAQPDIERLVFEREQFFADLQNHLTAVAYQLQTAVPESSLVHVLHSRLAALLEGDAILAERLRAYRTTLNNTELRSGKAKRSLTATAVRRPLCQHDSSICVADHSLHSLCVPFTLHSAVSGLRHRPGDPADQGAPVSSDSLRPQVSSLDKSQPLRVHRCAGAGACDTRGYDHEYTRQNGF